MTCTSPPARSCSANGRSSSATSAVWIRTTGSPEPRTSTSSAPSGTGTRRVLATGGSDPPAPVRLEPPLDGRTPGHDAGGVHVALHHVVVLLDLVEVDGLAETGRLEEVTCIAPQVGHLDELVAVALEVAVIDGV